MAPRYGEDSDIEVEDHDSDEDFGEDSRSDEEIIPNEEIQSVEPVLTPRKRKRMYKNFQMIGENDIYLIFIQLTVYHIVLSRILI